MLQAIHVKRQAPQACSLYCQWIRVDEPQGMRLVAVWIDRQMRAFATDFPTGYEENSAPELVREFEDRECSE